MQHLMIDLETMGTRFDAPVLAIGAVFFDPDTGQLGEKFYRHIDMEDACRYGKVSGATIKWWLKQSDAAREAITRDGGIMATQAFTEFQAWILGSPAGTRVKPWGNGATFDISILEYAFLRIIDREAPWKFWSIRDCRTIKEVAEPFNIRVEELKGVAHHALDDAVHQAGWISTMWQALRGKVKVVHQPTPAAAADEYDLG